MTDAPKYHGYGRKTDPLLDSFGTLSPRAPTPMERMASMLSQLAYGNDDRAGYQNMLSVLGNSSDKSPEAQWRDFFNPLAALDAAYNSGQDIGNGQYLPGIAGLLAGMAPIPGKRGMGRKVFDLDYFGSPVRIWANPEKEALTNLINKSKHKAMRRIKDPQTGDVFVWDAGDPALHAMVAKELGIEPDEKLWDIIGID